MCIYIGNRNFLEVLLNVSFQRGHYDLKIILPASNALTLYNHGIDTPLFWQQSECNWISLKEPEPLQFYYLVTLSFQRYQSQRYILFQHGLKWLDPYYLFWGQKSKKMKAKINKWLYLHYGYQEQNVLCFTFVSYLFYFWDWHFWSVFIPSKFQFVPSHQWVSSTTTGIALKN